MTARITAARRSPVVPRGGALSRLDIHQLGAPVVRACLADAGLEPGNVDEVIVSNALGAGGNPARLVALAAGLPEHVAGLTIDRQCAGGLDALLLARALIESGQADIVIAGGVESYSRRPLRFRTDPGGGAPRQYDRPAFSPFPDRDPEMAVAADRLARSLGISRGQQDDWAIASHRAALEARARLCAEIVPLAGVEHDAFTRVLTAEHCRRARALAGDITAANAAVAADAAAFCVVASERAARSCSRPGLRLSAGATRGGAPDCPGLAPVAAIRDALCRAAITPDDLWVAEIMEAYAAQAIACVRRAGLRPEGVNPGGGALARGHPVGASGAVLAVRLWHELMARGGGGSHGLAAIAAAGGVGTALVMSKTPA